MNLLDWSHKFTTYHPSRRKFIKNVTFATAGLGTNGIEQSLKIGSSLLAGSALFLQGCIRGLTFNYDDDLALNQYDDIKKYPNKIQPPDYGCLLGLQGLFERKGPEFHQYNYPEMAIDLYKEKLGYAPAIFTNQPIFADMINKLNHNFISGVHNAGVIPFTFYSLGNPIKRFGSLKRLIDNNEFINETISVAKGVESLKIPIFLTTMREMNLRPLKNQPWTGKNPKITKAVWKQIWQIFEDQGANQYTTWIWEIVAPETQRYDYPIIAYYPGDEFVDWVGISSYSRSKWEKTNKSFYDAVSYTYPTVRKNFPGKPVIFAELGKTRTSSQDVWLQKAFAQIQNWPGIKAVVYWNSTNVGIPDDHTLAPKSRKVFNSAYQTNYFHSADDLGRVSNVRLENCS